MAYVQSPSGMIYVPDPTDAAKVMQAQQNAMLTQQEVRQKTVMANEAEDAARKRDDLESLLKASHNPEFDAYKWAQINDPAMHQKLQEAYLKRFTEKVKYDPIGAGEELRSATGENIEMGKRYTI